MCSLHWEEIIVLSGVVPHAAGLTFPSKMATKHSLYIFIVYGLYMAGVTFLTEKIIIFEKSFVHNIKYIYNCREISDIGD